jgi:hypothetical protein
MSATWFSRTWATATALLTAGPCPGRRGDGGDHEDVAGSPVQRPPRLRPLGHGPRACPLRGRRTHGFAAPANDQVAGVIRATSGSVYKRRGCRNHAFALALVRCRPGPSSSAATTRRYPGPFAPWAIGFSGSRAGSTARRRNSAGLTHFRERSARAPELPGRTDAPAHEHPRTAPELVPDAAPKSPEPRRLIPARSPVSQPGARGYRLG